MINSENRNISTYTMPREFNMLGLNSCVVFRKPLISEANWKKISSTAQNTQRLDSGAM